MEVQRETSISEGMEQIHKEKLRYFSKICEAIVLQISSRLVEATEKSIKVEDEEVTLIEFATLVTDNNA